MMAPSEPLAESRSLAGDKTSASALIIHLIERLHFLCAVVGMPLLAMMITIDVATRYLFRVPFSWSNELEQIILLVVLVGCVPYCTLRSGHVYMDAVYQHLTPKLSWFANILRSLSGMVFFFSLAYGCFVDVPHHWKIEKATAYLHIPWSLLGVMVGVCGLLSGLVLLRDFEQPTFGSHNPSVADQEGV